MNDLSFRIIYDKVVFEKLLAIRKTVLVDGRRIPLEQDLDGLDENAMHVAVYNHNFLIGCARVLPLNEEKVQLGRIALLPDYQRKGIGTLLMCFLIDYCKQQGFRYVLLDTYVDTINFYLNCGFKANGKEYDWSDGYRYLEMKYEIQ